MYASASYASHHVELYSINLCPKVLSVFVLFYPYLLSPDPLKYIYTNISICMHTYPYIYMHIFQQCTHMAQ